MKVKIRSKPDEWLEVLRAEGSAEERQYELSDGNTVKRPEIIEFKYDEELGDVKLKLDS